jgi:hypothetical protein
MRLRAYVSYCRRTKQTAKTVSLLDSKDRIDPRKDVRTS